jgi:hypothetical protein
MVVILASTSRIDRSITAAWRHLLDRQIRAELRLVGSNTANRAYLDARRPHSGAQNLNICS